MKQSRRLSLRMLAVLVAVVLSLGLIGIAFAAFNLVPVDRWNTGAQTVTTAGAPDGGAYVFSANGSVVASAAVGGHRSVVITATMNGAAATSRAFIGVDTTNHRVSLSSDNNVTPTVHIQWDGGTDPLTFNPTGLGSVDYISTTNDGFILEFNGDDLIGTVFLNAYSSASDWSQYTLNLPGGIANGSHVDLFVPFGGFVQRGAGPANFSSISALSWDIAGTNSLDLQLTDYYASNERDFGDLPEDGTHHYDTTLANNGARHTTGTGLRLGANVDAETDGQPNLSATGDDTDNNAPYPPGDEEGVSRGSRLFAGDAFPVTYWRPGAVLSGFGGSVNVVVNGPCTAANLCHLRGWVDWNANGVLEPTEVIITGTGTWNGEFSSPIPGGISKYFDIPASPACFGSTCYARFRLCGGIGGTADCDSPNGPSATGEVEDYAWVFGPNAVTLNNLEAKADTPNNTAAVVILAASVLALGVVGVAIRRRRTA